MLHTFLVAPLLIIGGALVLASIAGFLGWLKGGLLGVVLITAGTILFFTL